uniref:Uncharacterized protein n=1 Tax=Ditylenchus dipsaci TaxID=166011 RepID=A0A915EEQ0_9BILA
MKLLTRLLAPCPERRISAFEALKSDWFEEKPFHFLRTCFQHGRQSEQNKKPPPQKVEEEKLPEMSAEQLKLLSDLNVDVKHAAKSGFTLKFGAQKKSR